MNGRPLSHPASLTLRGRVLSSPLLLAPMMDLAGSALRGAVRAYGGCGLYFSEMINARRVLGERPSQDVFDGLSQEPDLLVQLLGCDPTTLSRAAQRLADWFQPAGFDLNLGCARAKIMRLGWGAALLADRPAAGRALRALREVVDGLLTVKLRTVWTDTGEERDFVRMLEEEGADAVVVHPRATESLFGRPAHWERIARIKAALRIPVIGNGDVRSPEDAEAMLAQTGCDGVMIGRAAAWRPDLFRAAAARLAGRAVPAIPTLRERFESVAGRLEPVLDRPKRVRELRLFCRTFAEGLPVPHWFWGPLQSCYDGPELLRRARAYLQGLEHRGHKEAV